MTTVRIAARSAWLQAREFFLQPMSVIASVVQPTAFCLLAILVDPGLSQAEVAQRIVGVTLIAVWANSIWAAGMMLYLDRTEGTLATVLLLARRPLAVLVGRSLGAALAGSCGIAATVAAVLGGLGDLSGPALRALGLLALPALLSSTATGILVAGLFIRMRSAPRIAEALLYPVFVCSGALLPLTVLPWWARLPARGLPLYWVRSLFDGIEAGGPVLGPACALVAVSAGYASAGVWVFRRATVRSRIRGDLDFS